MPERLYAEYKGTLFFIEFNILIFIMINRQKSIHLNPRPAPALQPAPKPPNPWVMP